MLKILTISWEWVIILNKSKGVLILVRTPLLFFCKSLFVKVCSDVFAKDWRAYKCIRK